MNTNDLFKQFCRIAYTGYVPEEELKRMLDNIDEQADSGIHPEWNTDRLPTDHEGEE
jgi:hypothetical protein